MAESKREPDLDKRVGELHEQLVTMLGRPPGRPPEGEEPGEPYWDTRSTSFQDDFKGRVDELLKTVSAAQPGAGSRSGPKQTSD